MSVVYFRRKEETAMGYRKVSYLEQIWYILRWKLKELFRKEVPNEHKATKK